MEEADSKETKKKGKKRKAIEDPAYSRRSQREKNRVAASRYRSKKRVKYEKAKKRADSLEVKCTFWEAECDVQLTENDALRQDVFELRIQLQHARADKSELEMTNLQLMRELVEARKQDARQKSRIDELERGSAFADAVID